MTDEKMTFVPSTRPEIREIVDGWLLIDDFDFVSEKIEEVAAWVQANGGLEACNEDEKALFQLMIDRQIALAGDVLLSAFNTTPRRES